ncbi:MAG TPA: 3-oxoadipate enol-lactonase [Bryobacteraceae bacterium]|jgi:3-oxoadipate enol-lactonase/4-carboxymuconolactone decarboxylase
MPFAKAGGVRLFYRLDGNTDKPVVVFVHSLGTDHSLWDRQAEDLLPYFRVLRCDVRGHGASESTPGDYSVAMLAGDVVALASALGIEKFALCGLSLGGMIGQWLGANQPERLTHLVLANTSAKFPAPEIMESRRQQALATGMSAFVDSAMQRGFLPESLAANPVFVASMRSVFLATDPVGYAGCCAAIRDLDQVGLLEQIRVPTLVIGGDRDISTPWEGHGDVLAARIPCAKHVVLPAAHLSNLERPRSFSAALLGFLLSERDAGEKIRREVLGDEHVDRAAATTTDFNRDFQELITRFAWGTIWSRPGLDRRTRRLLVLAITASTGKWEEFRLHVRTGLKHELEPCDLEEVLLQTAVYSGVPAANTGFHVAREEME